MNKTCRNAPLLTIAVPTYNRANYLDLCLSQICRQIKGREGEIELIVSNNNSTDDTDDVVRKYMESGAEIKYVKNPENIGAEKNVIQCFDLARGKYALVFGDDDVLCDGALNAVVPLLKDDYGVVYLKTYSYFDDYRAEAPKRKLNARIVYKNKKAFIRKVNVQFTFISSNIVNKSLIGKDLDTDCCLGSNLPQLAWIFPALFKADRNVYLEKYLVAQKADNTGGYKVCAAFGAGLHRIFGIFRERGISGGYFNIISTNLLVNFIPSLVLSSKKKADNFQQEDFLETLVPVYRSNALFWIATYPVLVLPRKAGKIWHKTGKFILKMCRLPLRFQT